MAVSTLKEVDEFRKTRKLPSGDVTSAALPGAESALLTDTDTVRPDAEPLTTGSGLVPGLEGDVGFPSSPPPPQAGSRAPTAASDAA
jgi:hypothetical protein